MNLSLPDVEYQVIGSLLSGGIEALDEASTLEPEHFFSLENRKIFNAILDLHREGQPIDLTTVSARLPDKVFNIAEAATQCHIWAHIRHHADMLREKHRLRQLIAIADRINHACLEAETAREVLPNIESDLFALSSESTASGNKLKSSVIEVNEKIDLRLRGEVTHYGLPSGIKAFDEIHGGFQKGLYYALGGYPSAGKTAFACQCLLNIAVARNTPCLFISIEMAGDRIVERMACSLAGLNFSRYLVGGLSYEQLLKMKDATEAIKNSPLILDCPTDITGTEIRSMIRKAKRTHDIELCVVDYLQKVLVPSNQDEKRAIGDASQQLQRAGKETGVPCLVLSQLNRASQKEARPRMSHLAESTQIERDADCIDILWYEEDPLTLEPGQMLPIILTVDKNKEGLRGDQKLLFDGPTLTFKERN